jgi:hypothetical protein
MLTETLLRIPFSVIGRCSLVPTSQWLQEKCARINFSQAASGVIIFCYYKPLKKYLSCDTSPLNAGNPFSLLFFIRGAFFEIKKLAEVPFRAPVSIYDKEFFLLREQSFQVYIFLDMYMYIVQYRYVPTVK